MMDAIEFAKEMKRMIEYSPRKNEICYDIKGIIRQDPEFAVRIVEEWSKAHPIQTNADKFKEVFGVAPYNDLLEDYVCPPSAARGEIGCSLKKRCDECAHSYWDMPYEAPKGADNE